MLRRAAGPAGGARHHAYKEQRMFQQNVGHKQKYSKNLIFLKLEKVPHFPQVEHVITLLCQVFQTSSALLALVDSDRIYIRCCAV